MRLLCLIVFILASTSPFLAMAEKTSSLPRMASLRANPANVRAGPGLRYPILWVFRRRGMPVEIIAEYEIWRRIRDWEGEEGWVHSSLISSRRTLLVRGGEQALHQKPSAKAPKTARLAPGMVAQAHECDKDWCRASVAGLEGWVRRTGLWGLYPSETFD